MFPHLGHGGSKAGLNSPEHGAPKSRWRLAETLQGLTERRHGALLMKPLETDRSDIHVLPLKAPIETGGWSSTFFLSQ